jgi:hypothetical protein
MKKAKPEIPITNIAAIGLWHGNSSDIRTDKREGKLGHEFVGITTIHKEERF